MYGTRLPHFLSFSMETAADKGTGDILTAPWIEGEKNRDSMNLSVSVKVNDAVP